MNEVRLAKQDMKSLNEFLALYSAKSTRNVYKAGITLFLETVYRVKRSEVDINSLSARYLTEDRDYMEDLLRFAVSLQDRPPITAKAYFAGVKEFLAANDIELTRRQIKTITNRLPKGNARTVERDMDVETLRKILAHMDIKGKALVMVLASSGMRIGEALQITLDDLDLGGDGRSPPMVRVRGEYTKTGMQRVTFLSREAREALSEWLKVRDSYLASAQHRNNGLVGRGIGKTKSLDDHRVFPFSMGVVDQMWTNALSKAGLLTRDSSTGRKQLRIHQLRKFFRSQLALKVPVDIVEYLMGHSGYLTDAYRRYTNRQLAEFYQKGEHLLYINIPQDIQKIQSEFREDLDKNRKIVEDLTVKNADLDKKVRELEAKLERVTGFLEQAKKNTWLLQRIQGKD